MGIREHVDETSRRVFTRGAFNVPSSAPFALRWVRRDRPDPLPVSRHPQVEIQFIKRGQGQFLIGRRIHAFRPNSLLLIPPRVSHCFTPDPDTTVERVVVMFSPSLPQARSRILRLPPNVPRHLELNEEQATDFELVLRSLRREEQRKRVYWIDCVVAELQHLLALVRRAAGRNGSSTRLNPMVTWLTEQIEEHFREPLSLTCLAAKAGYSLYYLSHLFREGTNMSIKQYIIQRRVAEAKRLLVDERELTVRAVGMRAGFSSLSLFCRTFRKVTGITPTTFRESA